MKSDHKQNHQSLKFSLILLAAAVLVNGIGLESKAIFWDDLANAFFAADGGAALVARTVATARPALAPLFYIPYRLLGADPRGWYVFNLATRWLMFFSFYALLQIIFPARSKQNQMITMLALVYPGFRQLWIARIYPPIYISFTLEFLALILFARSLQKPGSTSWMVGALSLLLSFYCLNASEYVFGLELLRPCIAGIILRKKTPDASTRDFVRKITLAWLPYALMLTLFIILRTFIFESSLYDVTQTASLLTEPVRTLSDLLMYLARSALASLVVVWDFLASPQFLNLLTWRWIFLLPPIVSIIYLTRIRPSAETTAPGHLESGRFYLSLMGVLVIFFSGVPFWAAGLTPGTDFPNDRFFLPYTFGAAILWDACINLLRKHPVLRNIVFSVVFSVGAIFHMANARIYQHDWENARHMLNQISWRAPSFTENTFLVTEEFPLRFYSDNSLTGVINWLYAVEPVYPDLPIMLNYTTVRLGRSLPSLAPHSAIRQGYLLYSFLGSTDDMIVLFHQPPACLRFADPRFDHLHPDLPDVLSRAAAYSNLDLVLPQHKQNDLFFLAQENTDWCFYYQKASLALQYGQIDEIIRLGGEAFSRGLAPHDPAEAIPFIFAYAARDDWNRALQLSMYDHAGNSDFDPMLCAVWNIIGEETTPGLQKSAAMAKVNSALSCAAYH